ncbi:hypothetical protein D1114_18635, partial [Cereibacter sphaeroides]
MAASGFDDHFGRVETEPIAASMYRRDQRLCLVAGQPTTDQRLTKVSDDLVGRPAGLRLDLLIFQDWITLDGLLDQQTKQREHLSRQVEPTAVESD